MSNPVLQSYNNTNYSSLGNMSSSNTAHSQIMSMPSVMNKGLIQLSALIASALLSAKFIPLHLTNIAAASSASIALILSFIIMRKSVSSPILIMAYAILEGVFVGVISANYSDFYQGIVPIAVTATIATVGAVIAGMRFGFLRTTPKTVKIFGYMLLGYFVFSLSIFVLSLFGVHVLTLGSPLAIVVSILGTIMAAYSILVDVENVQNAVNYQMPEKESWRVSFGLIVSIIWLYLEILRLVANIASISR